MTAAKSAQVPILRLFAVIADGERGALVGPAGDVVWMCAPGWDGEAVFTRLLGGAGSYEVTPAAEFVWGGFYEENTLIWRSRWVLTGNGQVECREALAFPGDPKRIVLLRRVIALKHEAKVGVKLNPRAGFGREPLIGLEQLGNGLWTGRTGRFHLRWTGGGAARERDGALAMELRLREGEVHDLVLELSPHPILDAPPDAPALWEATQRNWKKAIPEVRNCLGSRDAAHAFAVLRGLTTANGAMVAAATTSLPERADTGRDYDYRFAWIRDQSYAGQAIAALGAHPPLPGMVRFVRERLLEDGPDLRPVYTASGKEIPRGQKLNHLPGYPGADPIVVGNPAGRQFQLDVFGEALLLLAAAARHDCLEAEDWEAAEVAVRAIKRHWKTKGSGVWEIKERRWVHSRLICVAGLRAMAKAARPSRVAAEWPKLADDILARTTMTSLHRTGRWQRSLTDSRVDASLLLAGIRGALAPDDPRSLATLRAVEEELVQDGYCYRFRASTPLSKAEGAFTICGFWLSLAYASLGRLVEANRSFERARAACGPPGLFAEEYDVVQRELRGNLPQAFVHALLLESAVELGKRPDARSKLGARPDD